MNLDKYSKTICFKDLEAKLVALLSTEASSFIEERLKPFKQMLQQTFPQSFDAADSRRKGYKFHNIQLDIYNRFAENVRPFLSIYL